MKRMHIHVGVEQLETSIKFYNALFGVEPAKIKADYAKWMLEDPRINFAISTRAKQGVDHLGLQVDDETELAELRSRLQGADLSMYDEGESVCCYARSDKSWVQDPSGVPWEAFQSMADAQLFSSDDAPATAAAGACCTPASKGQPERDAAAAPKAACC